MPFKDSLKDLSCILAGGSKKQWITFFFFLTKCVIVLSRELSDDVPE